MTLKELYPVAILQDRYGGVYSGGGWLAIASADEPIGLGGATRALWCLMDGPSGGDNDAMLFWVEPVEDWIAAGDTPNAALAELIEKMR